MPSVVSFSDWTASRDLTPMMRSGFKMYVRLNHNFNLRTPAEWDALYDVFSQADRRRRV